MSEGGREGSLRPDSVALGGPENCLDFLSKSGEGALGGLNGNGLVCSRKTAPRF